MRPPLICTVITGPSYEAALEQIRKNTQYSSLFEFRVDLFIFQDEQVSKLMQETDHEVLLTLRGQNGMSQRLRSLAHLKPAYLDLESDLPDSFFHEMAVDFPEIKVIASEHLFDEHPVDLLKIYQEMSKKPASLYKLAVKTRTAAQAIAYALQAREISPNFLFVPMGQDASCGRLFSQPFTFAGDNVELGQITAQSLIEDYKLDRHSIQKYFALIGDPVTYSIGHCFHNSRFALKSAPSLYFKARVEKYGIEDFLKQAAKLPLHGFSVTMPLKEAIIPYLDRVDQEAAQIGAVNTVVLKEGKWFGLNTDGAGALNALERYGLVRECKILIAGTGGASKAIAFEASRRGASVYIHSRDPAKSTGNLQEADLLINCTPFALDFSREELTHLNAVMDIRVGSSDCPWLKNLKKWAIPVIEWQEMFVQQALLQSSCFCLR